MWHENRREMKQFLKTLFRLDNDQAARYIAKNEESVCLDREAGIRDYYEFEAYIMFDDAMETTESRDGGEKKREPYEFVQQLIEIISEARMADYQVTINLEPPSKLITPYGGRLEWTLPGGNKLAVHLKDKLRIRHKKRWSQIMYLYYLIGYKLVNSELQQTEKVKDFESAQNIFENLPKSLNQQLFCLTIWTENTYVMALDGDVDFSPEALQLLIDRMKKNTNVGATCGRIKPGGSGPVMWYQKFEYAIGHWLQKSAEHVFGCVLCSPGCFSLFRAKALMDDNIMRTYANLPTEPKHYIHYDQGEDRWLCTLFLQQGYRIEYCAAAEVLTFAPEEFREFFRNKVAYAFFFVNGLWLVIMTAMNEVKNVLNIRIQTVDGITIIIEPLGLLFLLIFALLLFLQLFGMIRHRYGTFLHLLAATNLRSKYFDPEDIFKQIKEISSSTEQDFVVQSNSRGNTKEHGNKNAKNMATSIKRPSRISGNFPFDLKKTYQKNLEKMQQSNEEMRFTRVGEESV